MTWLDEFWARVEVRGECWVGTGYGHIYVRGFRKMLAHRISYELATGEQVPSKMLVCHHCDNPPCVRPDHLFIGTVAYAVQPTPRKPPPPPERLYSVMVGYDGSRFVARLPALGAAHLVLRDYRTRARA